MAVRIRFAQGQARTWPMATRAVLRGGLLLVIDGERDVARFDAQDVIEAMILDDGGRVVQTIRGLATLERM